MEERIVYKAECGIIHKAVHKIDGGMYTKRTFKDGSVHYPSEKVRHHFTRNGVSLQKLLELLYENKIDYKSLYAIPNKCSRIIFKNEIIKPIFKMVTGISGGCIYIKCKNSQYCDVFLMTGSEFAQIEEEDLFFTQKAVIARRDKIDNDIMRFCKRFKTKVYIKEDCTKEVRQTVKNTKNVIKLKAMKKLMYRINNGDDNE